MSWRASGVQRRFLIRTAGIMLVAAMGLVAACSSDSEATPAPGGAAAPVTLRLGYFPNVTHAQPIVGLARGTFAEELGSNVTLEVKTFNAGPTVIEAMFAGALDAAYIGPNPAITGYTRSGGKDIRIVAGATSGGALLVVRADSGITKAADLAGKRVATPQLGNTQDVALRAWLALNGLKDRDHGGNVNVTPIANADTLTLFQKGDLQAAWVPEPWASRLIVEANGRVLVDERDLWPNGDFATTVLIVRPKFAEEHPDAIQRLLRAHVRTTQWIGDNPDEAKRLVNTGIKAITGAALSDQVMNASWRNMRVTYEPMAASLRKSADDAFTLGYLGEKKPDLGGIYSLDALNRVLTDLGLKPVSQ